MDELKRKLLAWIKIKDRGYRTKCFIWQRGRNNAGYGSITWRGQPLGAHRASWLVHVGLIPEGLWVCHRCDVRPCIRPDHLFLGTPSDNVRDMLRKRGEDMSEEISMAEKKRIILDTYHARAMSDLQAGGRFAAAGLSKSQIVGGRAGPNYSRSGFDMSADAGPGDRVPFDGPTTGYDMRTLDGSEPASEPAVPSQAPLPPVGELLSDAYLPASTSATGVDAGLSQPEPECYSRVTKGSPQYLEPSRSDTSSTSLLPSEPATTVPVLVGAGSRFSRRF
jgi:HNH endonuclease